MKAIRQPLRQLQSTLNLLGYPNSHSLAGVIHPIQWQAPLHQCLHTRVIESLLVFLVYCVDPIVAKQKMAGCWPILDRQQARLFRTAVMHLLDTWRDQVSVPMWPSTLVIRRSMLDDAAQGARLLPLLNRLATWTLERQLNTAIYFTVPDSAKNKAWLPLLARDYQRQLSLLQKRFLTQCRALKQCQSVWQETIQEAIHHYRQALSDQNQMERQVRLFEDSLPVHHPLREHSHYSIEAQCLALSQQQARVLALTERITEQIDFMQSWQQRLVPCLKSNTRLLSTASDHSPFTSMTLLFKQCHPVSSVFSCSAFLHWLDSLNKQCQQRDKRLVRDLFTLKQAIQVSLRSVQCRLLQQEKEDFVDQNRTVFQSPVLRWQSKQDESELDLTLKIPDIYISKTERDEKENEKMNKLNDNIDNRVQPINSMIPIKTNISTRKSSLEQVKARLASVKASAMKSNQFMTHSSRQSDSATNRLVEELANRMVQEQQDTDIDWQPLSAFSAHGFQSQLALKRTP